MRWTERPVWQGARAGRELAVAVMAASCLSTAVLPAQTAPGRPAVTAEDYARAERFLGPHTAPLVLHGRVSPTWGTNDRFWYRTSTERGEEFVTVDPATRHRGPAFDQSKLASALSAATGTRVDPWHLPFSTFTRAADGASLTFDVGPAHWRCDLHTYQCARAADPGEATRDSAERASVPSPDGRRAVFIRNFNLWVRDVATGRETQLTQDGVENFGYATDNAGWRQSDRPVVLWSPDSRKIATYQQDQRGVGEMYLVETTTGHPKLRAWKYPLPGDDTVTTIQRVVITVDTPHVVRLHIPPDQHRSTVCDDIACGGELTDVQWSPDGTQLAFVSTSRDHKREQFRIADATTGEVRDVFDETVPTFFESGAGQADWRYLPASHEVIWFSERSNWGQLYLYDTRTGQLKHPITAGEGNVTRLLRVDARARQAYFLGVGREKGRDPYFVHLYRVGLDDGRTTLLTPEDATHDVSLSPSGSYVVDSYSRPDVPPTSVLRDMTGRLLMPLERADISRLVATGWKAPIPITVKARDGATDLYGLLFRPTAFDSTRRYPIINEIYPGPQVGSVGSRSFAPSRGDAQALAELGFVVVKIDGMGTTLRSKRFHEAYYGDMADNTLPDQVAGMKELANRFHWIDIDRAGIWGHSGGGYATADAMFRYPDFFKVGVSEAGNHDNRVYEDDWAEKWQGLLTRKPDGSTNYDSQANELAAKNLKGHLLLAHGLLDDNVPPYNTFLVVHALVQANKDFDLILFTDKGHGFGTDPYMIRRRWDYFVRYLLGADPPQGYQLGHLTAAHAPAS